MKILVALGGNALLQKGEKPTINTQFKNAEKALKSFFFLMKKKQNNVVITHGNGPQVGNILIRTEEAKRKAYNLPLYVCGAQSQGEIGFILENSLRNIFLKNKIKKQVTTIVTMAEVSRTDSAFKNPTKPIGPFLSRVQANKLRKTRKCCVKQDSGRGFRRFVASPIPLKIIGTENIKKLMNNAIVIAVGGGGIPVCKTTSGYKGVDAVIDKDKASECIATSINADVFVMLTSVPCAYINFNKSGQRAIKKIRLNQAKQYLNEGQFAEGSMKPKIESAISFLENNKNTKNKKVIITNSANLEKAFKGKAGTILVKK